MPILSYLGIFVFAVTGVFKARTKHFNLISAIILTFAMAYGGGTTCDLLIGIKHVSWVNDNFIIILEAL
ncbi:TRIC cation channel family protein [Flavobacterium sp.]|uniref:TRIC cation channel family protein n=1 Tax=Flavobacterium sp. TaxID=239 RepID=UPI001B439078|nr:TRIC cation channel family protein [Flavobacterium sp.]MBP6127909.1 TRIC cation channel family protein [Flavobacterium sp.]